MISSFVEYLFLGLSAFLILKMTLASRKKAKTDIGYKKYIESKNSVIIFKEGRKSLQLTPAHQNRLVPGEVSEIQDLAPLGSMSQPQDHLNLSNQADKPVVRVQKPRKKKTSSRKNKFQTSEDDLSFPADKLLHSSFNANKKPASYSSQGQSAPQ